MGKAPGLRGSREKAVGADLRTLRRTAPIRVVMYHGQSLTNDIAFGEPERRHFARVGGVAEENPLTIRNLHKRVISAAIIF